MQSVLLLCTAMEFGGAENHALSLYKKLLERGYLVFMVVSRQSAVEKQIGEFPASFQKNIIRINRDSISKKILWGWWRALSRNVARDMERVQRICRENNITVIQCNEELELLFVKRMIGFGNLSPRIVYTRHIINRFKKVSPHEADVLVGVSSPITRYLKTFSPVATHIPPLYETEKFLHHRLPLGCEAKKSFLKSSFGIEIDPHAPVISVIAGLCGSKNHSLLFHAVHRLGKRVQLLLAGTGRRELRLRKLAKSLGVDAYFLGYTEKIPGLLFYSDFNVLPSKEEGLGLALVEASLMKKASIAASRNGVVDVVIDNETGLIFENGNEQDLAEKLARLIDDPALAKRLGESAYDHVLTNLCVDTSFEKYVSLYAPLGQEGNQ